MPKVQVMARPDHSLVMSAQYMTAGNGGIADVARMSARALGRVHATKALACLDNADSAIESVPVRAFQGSRLRFVGHMMRAARTASHIFYDFAGTARAHTLLFATPRPFAVWAHGLEVWENPRSDYLNALARADLVLVNSHFNLRRAETVLSRLRDVRLCELATDSDRQPERIGPSQGPPTVLLLGRIDRGLGKGHDILVNIWPAVVSAVPDARLIFAGGGDGLEELRILVSGSTAARAIELLGFVPGPELEAQWRRATVMAMPSSMEGFGLVYIEAMRRGIPVIASREDAGQEINRDGVTGYNISRARPDELAEAIIEMLRDHDLCRRFGAAGHDRWRLHYRFARFEERFKAATASFLGG